MSVTVSDLLALPSLRDARVVAGHGGLSKQVGSISVLEYADPSVLQDALFSNNEFYGSEIVITGFMNEPENVDIQCGNIRRLAEAGEVGIILFYVGVFMPSVDRRLLELADEMDFAMIVMPENRMDLRYSEVISEVMEAIFKDQNSSAGLVSDILERISLLPEHQRTVDTALKMLSDRTRASVLLADGAGRMLNAAVWPRTLGVDLAQLFSLPKGGLPEVGAPPREVCMAGHSFLCYRYLLTEVSQGGAMELLLCKEGELLSPDMVRQAAELVRLAVNLWSRHHDQVVISELVRAILKDEPIKMRRLADIFRIDVASIQTMWVIQGTGDDFTRLAPALTEEALRPLCETVVVDLYEGGVVAFMNWPMSRGNGQLQASALLEQMALAGLHCSLAMCHNLTDTTEVRNAYLISRQYYGDAAKIWPSRQWHTLQEMAFAATCRRTLEDGEQALQQKLAPLRVVETQAEDSELGRTLAVYLLDAEQSVARTAQLLFVHKNTVKYRIQRMEARLGHAVNKHPEAFSLYMACALERLIQI